MAEELYKISERAPKEMCAKELVSEYEVIRQMLERNCWASSYCCRLEDRATRLRTQLADLFIEQFTIKEQEDE